MLGHKFNKLKECIAFFIKYKGHRNSFVIFNTPEHGNIGDAALAEAEYVFFQKYFPEYCVCEVTANMWNTKIFKFIIGKKAPVFLHAGGYLGDLWPIEDSRVKEIMEVFKENEIIILPQSIYFTDTEQKQELIKETKEIYNSYSNLFIFVREKFSFDLLQKEIFDDPSRYKLVPDIALVMNKSVGETDRQGVLCCLRADIEKTVSGNEQKRIEEILGKHQQDFKYTDTVVSYPIKKENRTVEIQKKLDEFSSAKLVITDRLHGMIFATITGTPCIALNNISKKVEGEYQWIKDVPYVKCVERIEEEDIIEMIKLSNMEYDSSLLAPYYDEMAQIIKDKMK